jgi:hypothetical protein
MILMQITPAKKARRLHLFVWDTLPVLRRTYPTNRLPSPQRTFTAGDESPLPGGFAKGVGKLTPDMPFTKWGTALARKRPAKRHAT